MFVIALVGYFTFIYLLATQNAISAFFAAMFALHLAFTLYLAGKASYSNARRRPVLWLFFISFFGLGGFIWYYLAIYRKNSLQKLQNA